ncbi:hypothetical protein HPB52_024555 [Rhipicephalus sanguineus]|uniref:Ionotropic glutamate receptor C-terminal domain-containing protein n=1 Tax=Rhipicephalus sanguineus TaxID=34632 RepID=A0A9D4P940_RHISA|nr:hypothetical protein HPB52_024555 [Rhipicephalus sanguineus]
MSVAEDTGDMVMTRDVRVTATFVVSSDGVFGVELPNGSWSGKMGMLTRNEADITGGPLMITTSRAEVAHPSLPISYIDVVIFAGRPFHFSEEVFAFLRAFNWIVWLGTALAFLVIWVVYVGISAASALLRRTRPEDTGLGYLQQHGSVLESFDMLASALLSQTSSHVPARMSQRNLVAVWLLGLIVLRTSFIGQTKASLVVRTDVRCIEGIEDVANDPKITPVVVPDSGFLWLLEGEAAMIFTQQPIAGEMKERCSTLGDMDGEFYYAPKLVAQLPISLFMRKELDKQLRTSIGEKIELFVERGLIHKLFRDSGQDETPCLRESALSQQRIKTNRSQMDGLRGIFFTWLAGLAIATLALVAEKLRNNFSLTTEPSRREVPQTRPEGVRRRRFHHNLLAPDTTPSLPLKM